MEWDLPKRRRCDYGKSRTSHPHWPPTCQTEALDQLNCLLGQSYPHRLYLAHCWISFLRGKIVPEMSTAQHQQQRDACCREQLGLPTRSSTPATAVRGAAYRQAYEDRYHVSNVYHFGSNAIQCAKKFSFLYRYITSLLILLLPSLGTVILCVILIIYFREMEHRVTFRVGDHIMINDDVAVRIEQIFVHTLDQKRLFIKARKTVRARDQREKLTTSR
jgi:hypothetical protein